MTWQVSVSTGNTLTWTSLCGSCDQYIGTLNKCLKGFWTGPPWRNCDAHSTVDEIRLVEGYYTFLAWLVPVRMLAWFAWSLHQTTNKSRDHLINIDDLSASNRLGRERQHCRYGAGSRPVKRLSRDDIRTVASVPCTWTRSMLRQPYLLNSFELWQLVCQQCSRGDGDRNKKAAAKATNGCRVDIDKVRTHFE
jgi:hypothetical protein